MLPTRPNSAGSTPTVTVGISLVASIAMRAAGPLEAASRSIQPARRRQSWPSQGRRHRRARLAWCENRGLSLTAIRPFDVAAWVKDLQQTHGAPGVKQQLAAVRMLFDPQQIMG
jgi:hypothetical protein